MQEDAGHKSLLQTNLHATNLHALNGFRRIPVKKISTNFLGDPFS
jgi:hypothetical protein